MSDDPEEPLLLVGVEAVLLAFIAVEDHIDARLGSEKRYQAQKDKALDLLQWAADESDLGHELIKIKAAKVMNRKPGGTTYIGPFPHG